MHRVPQSTQPHVGWLLPAGTLFFMCGILLSRHVASPLPLLFSLLPALGAALFFPRWQRFAALMLAALSTGMLLGWDARHPALPAEGDCIARGIVLQTADVQDQQVQTVLTHVTLDGKPAPDAYWTFYLDEDEALPQWLVPGTCIQAAAEVYHPEGLSNPDGFNFREYLLQRGISIGLYGAENLTPASGGFSLRGWFALLRHRLAAGLMDVMGPDHGAYAAAMLLGTRDFIPTDDRAAFSNLGIAHILSVSGFHAGILISLVLLLTKPTPLPRPLRLTLEALLLGCYCLLTGGNAPVIRAAALLFWREYSQLRHRQLLPLHALCFIALIQLLGNPLLLTGASFQLSYSAVLGLLLVYPRLRSALVCSSRWGSRLWQAFAGSFSAQLGILLPQLYWFGKLPLLGVLLNMAVVPFAGMLILLYWLTLAALPVPLLNTALGFVASRATALLLSAVRSLSQLDFTALWTRQPGPLPFLGWILLLAGLSILLPGRLHKRRKLLCISGALLLFTVLIPLPEHTTTYIQFNVGSEDAALLQDQDMTVLIDTGENGRTAAAYLHQRRQSVELLIITHLHIDHSSGIRALLDAEIPVDVCCLPWAAETPRIDEEVLPLIEELRQTGTEIRYLSRGDVIPLPSGQITVLWPEKGRVFPAHDGNDVNLVLQAEIAGTTMLLTSDLTQPYAHYVAQPSDLLKVPHHGSKDDVSAAFLARVQPQALLLSNASESREAYIAGLAGDIPLYTSLQHGAVTIQFCGEGLFEVHPFLHR